MKADDEFVKLAGNTSVPSYNSSVQDYAVGEDWDAG
jgi:hypothetical protein